MTKEILGKYLFREVDVRAGAVNLPLLSVSRYYGVVPRSTLTDALARAEDLGNYKVCAPGDIVVNRMSAYQGAMGQSEFSGLVSPDYMVLRPGPLVHGRYLHHLFRSSWFTGEVVRRLRGIGSVGLGNVRTPRINADEFGSIPLRVPSLDEQRCIADFLDVEIGKMDAILRARSRMYELLDERIDQQILEVIGRSCLSGQVAGNPVMAMRWMLEKQVRSPLESPEVITAFRDGQVTARSLRRAEGYTNSASDDPQGQAVRVGDVVVHGLDGFAGAIGASEAEGNCSPVYHVLAPKGDGDALYYGRMLRTLALQGYLTGFSFSTRERAFDFRNWDMFGRIPIPVAPFSEQRHIGEQVRTVRPLRDKFDKFGKLLAERCQSLITAAVAGQFDVSAASGRNATDGVQQP